MLRDAPKKLDSSANRLKPESGTNRARRTAEQVLVRAPGRRPGSAYWLIAKNDKGRLEVLTGGLAVGEEALPVFSYEQEAEMFLGLWEVGFDGWRVRESTAGEVISVLYGPCASVERVTLDPLPEILVDRAVGLVSLSRERFVEFVLSRERPMDVCYVDLVRDRNGPS
ncbi:MAG TPA: hypothetical protein VK357_04970 [Rubrobacteraceae bacterium]|jgi:hypothetical protein|nr:hypothetical protein [Rubrobacteraceae bacterium]